MSDPHSQPPSKTHSSKPAAVQYTPVPQDTTDDPKSAISSAHHSFKPQPQKEKPLRVLRYQKRSLALLAAYLPCLIVPWILTCVLVIRPLEVPSYYNQAGNYPTSLPKQIEFWMRFIDVVDSIAAVLTVPVISALLAHGAVVYCERTNLSRKLTLRQTLALADRGWADMTILWKAVAGDYFSLEEDFRLFGAGVGSFYLWAAAALLLLSAIQAPIRQAVMGTETIAIMTCADLPNAWLLDPYCAMYPPQPIGYDPEPWSLARSEQGMVIPSVVKDLATMRPTDVEPYIWEGLGASGIHSNTFVSAIPNGTTTGILREHVMRINSTAECTNIDPDEFPSTCAGSFPFSTSFNRPGQLQIDVCVPGNHSRPPWTLSRDAQIITEKLYIRVGIDPNGPLTEQGVCAVCFNFTTRCSASTTRGYFELGNIRNNNTAGPLLETWPNQETLREDFNDYIFDDEAIIGVPNVVNTYPTDEDGPLTGIWSFDSDVKPVPGPLTTAALALFGQHSPFYVALNSSSETYPPAYIQICEAGNIPFLNLYPADAGSNQFDQVISACESITSTDFSELPNPEVTLQLMLLDIMNVFNPAMDPTHDPSGLFALSSEQALLAAMDLSSQVWLTATAGVTVETNARPIYSSPGSLVTRPHKTLVGTTVVSVLLFLQLCGLALLVYYIYSAPTWTTALDGVAIFQMMKGAEEEDIPAIGTDGDELASSLRKADGLVGVVSSTGEQVGDKSEGTLRLARGGEGVISKRLVGKNNQMKEHG